MTRNEAIKKIGQIYGLNISNTDLKRVGLIHYNRQENSLLNEVINTYQLLMFNLYSNNVRLKNVTAIHLIKNVVYYDLPNISNMELKEVKI